MQGFVLLLQFLHQFRRLLYLLVILLVFLDYFLQLCLVELNLLTQSHAVVLFPTKLLLELEDRVFVSASSHLILNLHHLHFFPEGGCCSFQLLPSFPVLDILPIFINLAISQLGYLLLILEKIFPQILVMFFKRVDLSAQFRNLFSEGSDFQ